MDKQTIAVSEISVMIKESQNAMVRHKRDISIRLVGLGKLPEEMMAKLRLKG